MRKVVLSMFVALFVLIYMGAASAKLGGLERSTQSSSDLLLFPTPLAADNTVVTGNRRGGQGGNQGGGQGGNQGGGQGGNQGGGQGGRGGGR